MPTKKYNPNEPGRQWPHRQMLDRIAAQDGCITWLLAEVRTLQKRVDKLERQQCGSQSHIASWPPGTHLSDGAMSK
jgi:hypothetical protein